MLKELPPGAVERTTRLVDRYFLGTRLRLREMIETEDGSTSTYYKLTQKVPAPDGGPGLLSSTYLNLEEHTLLAALPAAILRKTRRSVPPFGIDAYEGSLSGLFLAEVEFGDDLAMNAFNPPSWVVAEVTFDSRFTGGHLVTMKAKELIELLAAFGLHPSRDHA